MKIILPVLLLFGLMVFLYKVIVQAIEMYKFNKNFKIKMESAAKAEDVVELLLLDKELGKDVSELLQRRLKEEDA